MPLRLIDLASVLAAGLLVDEVAHCLDALLDLVLVLLGEIADAVEESHTLLLV